MAQKKDINYFSMHSLDLHEAFGTSDHILVSEDFAIVINGSPQKIPFLKEGNIYQIVEPRLVMVLSGEADVNLNLENYRLKAGSVVLTMPDVILEARHWSDDMKLIGIILKEDVHVQENIVLDLIPAEFDRLRRIAYILWDIANLKPFRKEMVHHLLQAMVADLQGLQAATEKTANEHNFSRGHMLFLNFKKLVSQHCERERSIPFYAEQLWISPHHLSAVISKASGQSAMYWINRAVILKAKVLLNTSGMMSYEVADRLNFPSAAAFNKFFKRETGQTPGEYQKSARS
jgi:AraC-like DNA-binding protein